MKKLLLILTAAGSAAIALPLAAIGQGQGTSGYTTGPGNIPTQDARTNPNPATTGTASTVTPMTGNGDPSDHSGASRNGVAETTGSAATTPVPVVPQGPKP